jgi:hypothetical protein
MFQPCTVCTHAQRVQIDVALRRGEGLRPVARQWGLYKTAVGRHRARHLEAPAPVPPAQPASPVPPTSLRPTPPPPGWGTPIDPARPALGTLEDLQAFYRQRMYW